jgi:hypothetical protein
LTGVKVNTVAGQDQGGLSNQSGFPQKQFGLTMCFSDIEHIGE